MSARRNRSSTKLAFFTSHLALSDPRLNSAAIRCPVSYDFIDPKYWFDRAEEVRIRSDLMRDPGNRETMLRIAADYERLGERAVVEGKRLREDGQIEWREPPLELETAPELPAAQIDGFNVLDCPQDMGGQLASFSPINPVQGQVKAVA